MKTYEPNLGESINECIENSLQLSTRLASFKKHSAVEFKFNGLYMVVDASVGDSEYYLKEWQVMCKERSEAYKDTTEYKEQQLLRDSETMCKQEQLDKHIIKLQDCFHTNHHPLDFAKWLRTFSELTDHTGVTYDKNVVLDKFTLLGYKENEYVGWKGWWSAEVSVKYITGQFINCLNNIGLIHPVAITMCDKVISEGGL